MKAAKCRILSHTKDQKFRGFFYKRLRNLYFYKGLEYFSAKV